VQWIASQAILAIAHDAMVALIALARDHPTQIVRLVSLISSLQIIAPSY
jgi:hypothetical protein